MLKRKNNKWKILGGIIILGGLAFGVWYKYFRTEPAPETVQVEKGMVIETVSLSGSLEPELYADLSFVGSGRVKTLLVEEGQEVRKGQLLMTLEDPVLQAQYSLAQVGVLIAEEQEKLARRKWDDLKKEQKQVTKLTSEQARANRGVTSAQFTSSQVRAPFASRVTNLNARIGESVIPGTVVARVQGAGGLVIRANVSESEVVKLSDGVVARVTFDALEGASFDATLKTLSLSAVKNQDVISYEAVFALENSDDRLRDGMTADIEVVVNRKDNVLTLPARTLRREGGGVYVDVYDPATKITSRREIVKGLEGDNGIVEIVRGIEVGEQVVGGQSTEKKK